MTPVSTFNAETCSAISDQLFESSSVRLSDTAITEIFADYDTLLEDIREWGVNDTDVRGRLLDELAQHLVGRDWPTYADGEAYGEAFERRLYKLAQERGYQIGDYAKDFLAEASSDAPVLEDVPSEKTGIFLAKNRHGVA